MDTGSELPMTTVVPVIATGRRLFGSPSEWRIHLVQAYHGGTYTISDPDRATDSLRSSASTSSLA